MPSPSPRPGLFHPSTCTWNHDPGHGPWFIFAKSLCFCLPSRSRTQTIHPVCMKPYYRGHGVERLFCQPLREVDYRCRRRHRGKQRSRLRSCNNRVVTSFRTQTGDTHADCIHKSKFECVRYDICAKLGETDGASSSVLARRMSLIQILKRWSLVLLRMYFFSFFSCADRR